MKSKLRPTLKRFFMTFSNPTTTLQKTELHRNLQKALKINKANNKFLSFFLGENWRYVSFEKTFSQITSNEKLKAMHDQANLNLASWQAKQSLPPYKVEVTPQDWGIAALKATQKYGKPYAVLNMANSQYPGGGFLEGGSAQEENMWMRTTCANSLSAKDVYFNEKENCFCYSQEARELLTGQKEMSEEECALLGKKRGMAIQKAHKVFLNPERQLCFRGPEVLLETDSLNEMNVKKGFIADSTLSFSFLPEEQIFPFYELRSAAPQLAGYDIDWRNQQFLQEYEKEIRRRISAQLDTLILNEMQFVILGAWGCGCFANNPHIVAKIYHEEIEKRAKHFQHIVFPIMPNNMGRECNFSVFKKQLDGLKLDLRKNCLLSQNAVGNQIEPFDKLSAHTSPEAQKTLNDAPCPSDSEMKEKHRFCNIL
ncbi:poly(ADP-ribose) glycohydrolase domain-containing protein [Legionella londiniensis]|uniref:Microbial-type PARG catalytic domain-containing protein n=1 Tax=Legionella londiniensis TaxID=45068 RepID=A0A0W0VJF4_9GAMM|nr:poly(ADP-ribose) glycohydrolase domain-containing protein [Legionella londiniensis]KTD19913.1 hypothetical protein Llon_2085 [Legionella londiniensis]STX94215.1 Uncharacterized protein conserved in bacteria [Legionella londiniensis]